jgi:hypothetical protein
MLTWIDWRTAPTWDEWFHLPSGLYHVQYGDFSPYRVNPPLVRMIAALPVLAVGGSVNSIPLPSKTPSRSEITLGHYYIHAQGARCLFLFPLARMALIPVSLLGTTLLWSIGQRFYGPASGWIAAVLWVFSPTALAFGGTIAPDVSAAVFGLLASYRFYIWLVRRDRRSALWLGAATAVAMLCKSTWIILPPIFLILWLFDRWRLRRPFIGDLRQLATAAVVALVLIHACYDFRGVLKPLGSFPFHSATLTSGASSDGERHNRFADSWFGAIPAPLPADYVLGIDVQRRDFEAKMQSYYFGQWRDHGWWSYYVVGIFLKEPIALWGLAGLLVVTALRGRQPRVRWREAVLFAPGVAVLALVSSQTGFNHHLRYVLPFFPCLYLIMSRSVASAGLWAHRFAAVCCLWYAISSASHLPRGYTFFSEAIGGSSQGWKYLGDSNLDWGQDLLALRDWARENPDKRPLWLLYTNPDIDFKRLGVEAEDGEPHLLAGRPNEAGWWAVFAFRWIDPKLRWFAERPATVRLTPAVKLIYLTPEDIKAIQREAVSKAP